MKPMSSKIFARGIGAVAVAMAGVLTLAGRATGADYDYGVPSPDFLQAPPQNKVEFASNWYVRGDLAYAAETFPKIAPDSTFGSSPSVLNTYSVGAGMGYKVNDWFRTDLILDYRSKVQAAATGPSITCITGLTTNALGQVIISAQDTCTSHLDTEIHRWDLLANGYVDLGTWDGFTPYLGAGAGVTWARVWQSDTWTMSNGLPYQVSTDGFFFDLDRRQTRMHYQFAWAVMAGVAIAMTDHAQLDVGYRFLDLGTISSFSNVTGMPASQRGLVNEMRAGVRYMID
jgi:opacity protein-like surface antigen